MTAAGCWKFFVYQARECAQWKSEVLFTMNGTLFFVDGPDLLVNVKEYNGRLA